MALRTIRVGMYGAGVVGGGVVTLLAERARAFAARGVRFELATICCREPSRVRDFAIPSTTTCTSDVSHIVNDASIDMVVEVMGGTDVAHRVALASAAGGKHFVTANKALLAAYLDPLSAAFTPAHDGASHPRLGYEAAVAGGVPIIRAMATSLSTDVITSLRGIMNGTTNFMLTRMVEGGEEYDVILKQAQAAGFAEADPSADVLGHDARNKLVLLTKLATGVTVAPTDVPTMGITEVAPVDMRIAARAGHAIKLIGEMVTSDEGQGRLELLVAPCLVPAASVFASTHGAMNAIQVLSKYVGVSTYSGPGAGRLATANSVVADMLAIATGQQPATPFPRAAEKGVTFDAGKGDGLSALYALKRKWYIRASCPSTADAARLQKRTWAELGRVEIVEEDGGACFACITQDAVAGVAAAAAADGMRREGAKVVVFPVV